MILRRSRLVLFVALSSAAWTTAGAQTQPAQQLTSHPDWPTASAADSSSPRAVATAFFSAISVDKGGHLDRMRLQSLFVPDGRIEIPSPPEPGRASDLVFMTPLQYADMSDNITKDTGFYDRVIAVHVQQFGVIAHVYASYASRFASSDPKPFVRGIKSFELFKSGTRWYIVNVAWDRERSGLALPEAFLTDRADGVQ